MIDNGSTERELWEEDFNTMSRTYKAMDRYRSLKGPRRDQSIQPEVIVLWGDPGTQKSRLARQMAPDAYPKNMQHKWWDGYDGHKSIILDEFHSSQISFRAFCQLLDRYVVDLEVKGGIRYLLATKFIITTNFHPSVWYTHRKIGNNGQWDEKHPLWRRITKILKVEAPPNSVIRAPVETTILLDPNCVILSELPYVRPVEQFNFRDPTVMDIVE